MQRVKTLRSKVWTKDAKPVITYRLAELNRRPFLSFFAKSPIAYNVPAAEPFPASRLDLMTPSYLRKIKLSLLLLLLVVRIKYGLPTPQRLLPLVAELLTFCMHARIGACQRCS